MSDTITTDVSLFGDTRPVQFFKDEYRLSSLGTVVVGRFPKGAKLHRTWLTLWKREQPNGRALRGDTAAVVDGEEYIADFTLYIHNRNTGRIVAWNDEQWQPLLGQWR